MSIRSLLMPLVTRRLLSRERLLKARAKAEQARRSRAEPHRVLVFHQVDDPYSALLAQCLPALRDRYDIDLVPHVVPPPADAAAPDRARLVAYSRVDAALLASHRGLAYRDPGARPPQAAVEQATRQLVAAAASGTFVDLAGPLSAGLWGAAPAADPANPAASAEQTAAHLAHAAALRQRLGHYLGATLHYGGEWYWGPDRLHHLEQRLIDLGAQRPGVSGPLFPPDADLATPVAVHEPPTIDFFFSLRSPYSAIVTPRVFELGRLTGAPVRLRYVLPMVMRGLPVPREKRLYISHDAAREAHVRHTPFGCLNDPVGRPTERGLALMPLAERQGLGPEYLRSFMHGVWAEGIDAGSDRGLRRIAQRAGLDWADAEAALHQDGWRAVADANRTELLGLGLWGVPSFRVGALAVWGQDRLWAVQHAIINPTGATP